MNIFVAVMLLFALLGFVDVLLGDRLGYGEDFRNGMANMGGLSMSCVGFYAIGVSFVTGNADAIAGAAGHLPFDPSLAIGSILAPDMGALPIASGIASSEKLAVFIGAMVAGSLGQTLGYQLPVFLAAVKKEEIPALMKGFIFGLIALPAGLLTGGLLLGLPMKTIFLHMIPAAILCVLLIACYLLFPSQTMRVMITLGTAIRLFSYVLFGLAVFGVFLPQYALADVSLVKEMLYLILRMAIVASGGLVLSHMVLKHFGSAIRKAGTKLSVNETSVMGLVLSLVQSLAMLPLFSKMDERGRVLNAAFSVSGAYVLGGQLAFVSSMVTGPQTSAYMISKIVSGAAGVLLALLFTRNLASKR